MVLVFEMRVVVLFLKVPSSPSKLANDNDDDHVPSWRKTVSLRNAIKSPFSEYFFMLFFLWVVLG